MVEKTKKETKKTTSTSADNNQTQFISLTDISEPYDTKRGKQFHALFHGKLNTSSTVRQAGERFAVSNLVNISGAADEINKRLGVKFVEDKNYHSISAQITWFTLTEKEAQLIANEQWVKGNYLNAPVNVGTHEYDGKIYLQLQVDTPYAKASGTQLGTPAETPSSSDSDTSEVDMTDDDLPF